MSPVVRTILCSYESGERSMSEIIAIAFKTGMILAGSFGFIGYLVGLCINLLNDYGRG